MNSSNRLPGRGRPTVEVSWGELLDKISILEIKEQRLRSPEAVRNVRAELATLLRAVQDMQPQPAGLDELRARLRKTNETLWDIEDQLRAKEAIKSFDQQFIELARSVYFTNDERSQIKREINKLMNSELVEEKQYSSYQR